jgi:hypothetical protein
MGNEGELPTALACSGEFPWSLAVGIENGELFPVTWPRVSKGLHEIAGTDFEFLVGGNHPSDLLRHILVCEGGADDIQPGRIRAPKEASDASSSSLALGGIGSVAASERQSTSHAPEKSTTGRQFPGIEEAEFGFVLVMFVYFVSNEGSCQKTASCGK